MKSWGHLGALITAFVIVLAATGCGSSEPRGNPDANTPTPEPEAGVDSRTDDEVRDVCKAQLEAEAASSKRHLSGQDYKPYDVVSISFTGWAEQIELPRQKIFYEIPYTEVIKSQLDGNTHSSSMICRVDEKLTRADMRR